MDIDGEKRCAVMCKGGFDFVFNPPLLYYCSYGAWQFYYLPGFLHDQRLPWPDCSGKIISKIIKLIIPTSAYCAYTQNSLHTRLSACGSLNKYSFHMPHGRNRPRIRKTKSLLNERKWRLKISNDSALFSNTCNNFLLSLSA